MSPNQPSTYAEYLQAVKAAEDAVREQTTLRRRVHELVDRLQAVELTPERLDDLGSHDLAILASHYHTVHTAIIEELRVRRHDIAEELIAPCVCALEAELAPAKEHVWDLHQQLRALEDEHKRRGSAAA